MKPKLLTRAESAATLAENLRGQYERSVYWITDPHQYGERYAQIVALGPNPDPDAVDAIMRAQLGAADWTNLSWTVFDCQVCGTDGHLTAVQLGEDVSEDYDNSSVDVCERCLRDALSLFPVRPIPMFLTCPMCSTRHIDEGEFATKPHHTHGCQKCGLTWRPAVVPTVGVEFLPGFKNEEKNEEKVWKV